MSDPVVIVESHRAASAPWWLFGAIVVGVLAIGFLILFFAMRWRPRKREKERRCPSCHRVVMPEWESCLFCGANVLSRSAELAFVSGPLNGQTVLLNREVTTIGSVAGNTVLLTDTGVSRKHVGIRQVEGGFELADLGSTNGVYINGEKVARRRLAVGDVIRLGTTEIVFKL
jgi:hypothetical protein